MNSWSVTLTLASLLISGACGNGAEESFPSTKPEQQEVKFESVPAVAQVAAAKLESAVQEFSAGRIAEGAVNLLDVVLLTRPDANWPDGAASALRQAREGFGSGQLAPALEAVDRALDLLKPKAEEDRDSGQIGPVAELVKGKIESSRQAFAAGDADRGVILILESLRLLGPDKGPDSD